jgi:hypothetical protein
MTTAATTAPTPAVKHHHTNQSPNARLRPTPRLQTPPQGQPHDQPAAL